MRAPVPRDLARVREPIAERECGIAHRTDERCEAISDRPRARACGRKDTIRCGIASQLIDPYSRERMQQIEFHGNLQSKRCANGRRNLQ